ncbi:hypothetical protein QR680_006831 [Steinernema hermaphroditum]|uniref:Protein kinase domain-containing protein n=1 Tax=Steinernema hermaphroditum TaxID=289476 RepID=A0AA39HWP5_9BILA|nr:hypothetical protein QR680_006831 [Steinernema hermaphroditum]
MHNGNNSKNANVKKHSGAARVPESLESIKGSKGRDGGDRPEALPKNRPVAHSPNRKTRPEPVDTPPAAGREENERSDAKSEMTPYYTPLEFSKPVCPRGAVVQVAEGTVTTDDAVVGDFGSIHCRFSAVSFPERDRLLMRYERRTLPFRRLKTEVGVFMMAKMTDNSRLFPHIHTRGTLVGSHIFFVCDMLGHNLTAQRVICGGSFNSQTVYRLAVSTLNCILTLHSMGFVHRDVKPNVFTVSVFPNANRIILSCAGLAKEMPSSKHHWKPRDNIPFLGTVRYSSRRNHRGQEQVFTDDLESWVYMVCEWIDPAVITWAKEGDKEKALMAKEDLLNADKGFKEALKRSPDLPAEFVDIVHYVNSLSGEFIMPQKTFIVDIIRKVQKRLKLQEEDSFQWCKSN